MVWEAFVNCKIGDLHQGKCILVNPKHTSKFFQRYIKSQDEQHPIELVWVELDPKLRARLPTTAVPLWQLLQESWAELYSVYLQSLVERMLRIREAVKGGHFDESKV